MASSAFKSTTQRTPINKTSSSSNDTESSNRSSAHRRSRSLSRFSRPVEGFDFTPVRRGKFVNTVRGSGFPEISLDDLAMEFFEASESSVERGRSGSRSDDVSRSVGGGLSVSQRRGRSVSRKGSKGSACGGIDRRQSFGNSRDGRKGDLESNSRRKRSVSAVRYQVSDYENDLGQSLNSSGFAKQKNNQISASRVQTASNHRNVLRRSISQKDFSLPDGYSSQSSALTDDEGRNPHSYKNGNERTIRTIHAHKAEHPIGDDVNGGLYEVMRKELRDAVQEIKIELENKMVNKRNSGIAGDNCLHLENADVFHAVPSFRRNSCTQPEKSDKQKPDLLAKRVSEKQHGREFSMTIEDLLPDKDVEKRPARGRKKSNDRTRMCNRLDVEAEKYIEDFISNLEDTDISSMDGERSETSSTFGGTFKSRSFQSPPISGFNLVEKMDDEIVLPWLEWETTNDDSPLSCKNNESPLMQHSNFFGAAQEVKPVGDASDHSISSSHGSWSPAAVNIMNSVDTACKSRESGIYQNWLSSSRETKRLQRYDVDDYLKHQTDDEFLYERLRQQQKFRSSGIILCNQMFF